jgi:hypothetical protein
MKTLERFDVFLLFNHNKRPFSNCARYPHSAAFKHRASSAWIAVLYHKMTASREGLNKMLDEYCSERRGDVKTGVPARAKLTDLGLAYVADEFSIRRSLSIRFWDSSR